MARPTTNMHPEAKNQPYTGAINVCTLHGAYARPRTHTMPTGPAGIEYARVEAMDGMSPMIEKAMPKTSIKVKLRRNSCL